MKIISYIEAAARFGDTLATDMDAVEFLKYARTNIGNISITFVHNISVREFQLWVAEGNKSILSHQVRKIARNDL